MALSKLKNTPYLVLFVILISVGVTSASALTITLGGDLIEILGILNMNNNKITNVGTPTVSTDGATKGYVDSSPTTDTLAGLSCGTDEIPRWDGINWVCGTVIVVPFSPVPTLVDPGPFGQGTSIAIGADNLPVISFYQISPENKLEVAHCGNASCSSGNTITTVDSTVNVGRLSSIAIGSDNLPVISYLDDGADLLKVVHCGDIDCAENINSNTITTVVSTGGRIRSSIAIGSDNLPVISYRDVSSSHILKVVHCGDIDCAENINSNTITTVDSTAVVGSSSSIAIGSDNLPVISYYDSTNGDLKVVHCGDIDCAENTNSNTITTVDSTDDVGIFTSIAIGADNLPVISYNDLTNNNLKVVHCGDIDCAENINSNTITTVDDSVGASGFNTSIAIGSDNLPVISYNDFTNVKLKVAHCGNASCSSGNIITAMASTGQTGTDTSIAIGADNLPVISFHGSFSTGLTVIQCSSIFACDRTIAFP